MMTSTEQYRALDLFAEYTRRRKDGESAASAIDTMRSLSAPLSDGERQRLIDLIRDWEKGKAKFDTATVAAVIAPTPATEPFAPSVADTKPDSQSIATPRKGVRRIGPKPPPGPDSEPLSIPPPFTPTQTALFGRNSILLIYVNGYTEPIVAMPDGDMMIGASSDATGMPPEIDLAPYRGRDRNVATVHGALSLDGDRLLLTVIDTDWGAMLNGVTLDPNMPHQLRDGDELRLGTLTLWVQFKPVIGRQ